MSLKDSLVVLEAHLVVVHVVSRGVIGIVKCISMLGCARLKGVLLIHIQCCKLVKVVYWPDLKLCANVGDERIILQSTEVTSQAWHIHCTEVVPASAKLRYNSYTHHTYDNMYVKRGGTIGLGTGVHAPTWLEMTFETPCRCECPVTQSLPQDTLLAVLCDCFLAQFRQHLVLSQNTDSLSVSKTCVWSQGSMCTCLRAMPA